MFGKTKYHSIFKVAANLILFTIILLCVNWNFAVGGVRQSSDQQSERPFSNCLQQLQESDMALCGRVKVCGRSTLKQLFNCYARRPEQGGKTRLLSSAATGVDADTLDYLEKSFAKLHSNENCSSLLKKHLTRCVFDRLKHLRTRQFGSTLKDVIQSGVTNADSGIGAYAPDSEAYSVFADLLDPIVDDYHGGFGPNSRQPASDFGDSELLGDADPDGEFVVSTRIRCGRSLTRLPFNPNMSPDHYRQLQRIAVDAFDALSDDLKGTYHPLEAMNSEVKRQLIEDHFLFKEGDRFLHAANACRHWPIGRGIFYNANKTFLVWVGEEDHLRIISMQNGGNIKQVYDRLARGVKQLERRLEFSRDSRLGFLTFCPTNLGTAVRASVHVRLPLLAAAGQESLRRVADTFNLQVRGTSGEHTEALNGVYDISNRQRLGITEFRAVQTMYNGVVELINMEKALRLAKLRT